MRRWPGVPTIADGLRLPAAGDLLVLRALYERGGTAVAVDDDTMLEAVCLLGVHTGIFVCLEGGATSAAALALKAEGWLDPCQTVTLFNNGSGLKHAHLRPALGGAQPWGVPAARRPEPGSASSLPNGARFRAVASFTPARSARPLWTAGLTGVS